MTGCLRQCLCVALLLLFLASLLQANSKSDLELEYSSLYDATEDKDALEAIRDLHRQLDDDNDGAIEPSETGDFIRADLQYGSDKQRQKSFHGKDQEITVKDLWVTWRKSDVFNWTVDQVVDWLTHSVELPQYGGRFRELGVNGTHLPKAAVSSSFLSKVLGITNPIHRSKINLKAMDVVLFGAPRDSSNFLKDVVLTTLLVVAVTGLLYAYRQNKKSQEHLNKMMMDMDGLAKAEQTLLELQDKLQQKDSKIESLSSTPYDVHDAVEFSRLKEELEILRSELHRAEVELEDKCWVAPPVLQHWLQLTYEIETSTYNAKKKAAEDRLELAKDMCEKLKKKRSSLVGAFVSTHGQSSNDVDRFILEARTALLDLTKDLTERTQRWRQIELLCGCSIITNPGIPVLQNLVRHLGRGHLSTAKSVTASNRLSGSVSQDDLMDDDTHSVAASSSQMTNNSSRPSLLSSTLNSQHKKLKSLSRESSKESSSSEEYVPEPIRDVTLSQRDVALPILPQASARSSISSSATRASTPPVVAKIASDSKRSRMVKSYSQDGGGSIQEAVALASVPTGNGGRSSGTGSSMTSSVSEGHLQQHEKASSASASTASSLKGSASNLQLSRSTVLEEQEESCSASDSGSMTSLEGKKKKKRSFFNFRRKKEKKDVM